MDSLAFWILVFPLLLVAVLYYLGFLSVGLGIVATAFKSKGVVGKTILLTIGLCIISFPFLAIKFQHFSADRKADQRQEELAKLERISLTGRMPRKFVTVGRYHQSHIDLIKKESRMVQFPQAENDRLAKAYRQYRRAEFCHSHSAGKTLSPKINIPICRDLPDSIHAVLKLKEPVLVFAEGSNTSFLQSNTHVGKKYELRLITPTDDYLVDYYENRTLERPAGITTPFSSGYARDSDAPKLHIIDFIQRNLDDPSG